MRFGALILSTMLALAAGGPAVALDPAYRPGVQLSFGFGGARAPLANRLRYSLRLEPRYREERDDKPAIVSLDFTGTALSALRLGGVPIAGPSLRLSQNETVPAEAPGWNVMKWGLPQWGLVIGGGIIGYAVSRPSSPTPPNPADTPSKPVVGCDDGSTIPSTVPPGTLGGGCV